MSSFKWSFKSIFFLISLVIVESRRPTVEVLEGETGLLGCPVEDSNQITAWITTDFESENSVIVLNQGGKVTDNLHMVANGSLVIGTAHTNMTGEYRCVANTPRGSRAAVIYLSVSSGELNQWDKYLHNVLIGVIVAASVLVVFTIGCLVYSYRWRPEKKNRSLSQPFAIGKPNDTPSLARVNQESMVEVTEDSFSDSVFERNQSSETRF